MTTTRNQWVVLTPMLCLLTLILGFPTPSEASVKPSHTGDLEHFTEELSAREQKVFDGCPDAAVSYVDGKCLEFRGEPKNWFEAISDCASNDGDLYEPDFSNPFLFQYWIKFFPQVFDSISRAIWVRIVYEESGIPRTLEQKDLSANPYFIIGDSPYNHPCGSVSFRKGTIQMRSDPCSRNLPYACEYQPSPIISNLPQLTPG